MPVAARRNSGCEGSAGQQEFVIVCATRGPALPTWSAVLAGTRKSPTGLGLGLLGARRLMDGFELQTTPASGTAVRLAKRLPRGSRRWEPTPCGGSWSALQADGPADAMEEIRRQNQQILLQMEELRRRQEDLEQLNQELQDTNRGVVALYAELDERADHLRRADELKSNFLSHMSHEFRTPLNSILALSRLLLSRSRRPADGGTGTPGPVHPQGRRGPDRAGERPAGPGEGRSRQDGGLAVGIHGGQACSAPCAACCGRC